ncbi:MAG: hypothetical protein M3083_09545 [Actinomycetota bacterium]|nr:hypothetical protein [Actinomycetota bacterium]
MPEPSRLRAGSAITAEQFERGYADTVGTTVEQLHREGRVAESCSCGWDECRGWVLGYRPKPNRATGVRQDGRTDR